MTMIVAGDLTTDEYNSISSSMTLEEVATALETQDESVASWADLFTYYVETAGQLPAFMTGGMLSPDDPELQAIWNDSDEIAVIQDWRQSNTGQDDMATLVSQMESFLQYGEDAGFSACDFTLTDDTTDFINEYYEAHPTDGSDDADSSGDETVLLSDMMNIALMMGNPGLAILFYIVGSETELDASTLAQNEDGGWSYSDVYGNEHTLSADSVTANSDGTYTIQTDNGEVTVDADDTVTFHNTGFGEIVQEFQAADLDTFNDLQEEIDSQTDALGDIDYEDPASTGEVEALKADIDRAQNIADVYTKLLEMVQEMLNNLVEAASSMIDQDSRTLGSLASRV